MYNNIYKPVLFKLYLLYERTYILYIYILTILYGLYYMNRIIPLYNAWNMSALYKCCINC